MEIMSNMNGVKIGTSDQLNGQKMYLEDEFTDVYKLPNMYEKIDIDHYLQEMENEHFL